MLAAASAGCIADDPDPPRATGGSSGLPDGVSVAVEFPRYLQVGRDADGGELEIAVTNATDVEVRVEGLALRSPMFEAEPVDERARRVEPGRRRDFKVRFGPAVCDAADEPSNVELLIPVDGGGHEDVRVRVDDADLRRIHAAECASRAVREQFDLTLGEAYDFDGERAVAQLSIARRAGDAVATVTAIRGSVLLTVTPVEPRSPLLTLDAGDQRATTDVVVDATRCDPHAVIESKKTYRFAVWVTLDGGDEAFVEVQPEPELRADLEGAIDACLRELSGG